MKGGLADLGGIRNGLAPLGGVHDQVNLAVLDGVHNVRAALAYFVHFLDFESGFGEHLGSAPCGDQAEAHIHQIPCQTHHIRLVGITHTDEGGARGGQRLAGAQCGLGKGFVEAVADAHHLAGGLHLRPQDRVHGREFREREDRFLHRIVLGHGFGGYALLLETDTDHAACGDARQRPAHGLGNEGHGPRGPRIHLDHVDLAVLPGQLHVHQPDHIQLQRHALDHVAHLVLDIFRQRVGRQ